MQEASPIKLKTFLPLVVLLGTMASLASSIYLPSLPHIKTFFSTSNTKVQFTLASYLFALSFSQLFYGPFSDQYGRRKAIFLGLGISLGGSVLSTFSWNIASLILSRTVQGLGLGAGVTLSRTIIRDVYSGDCLARLGAFVSVGTSVFMALGPLLGGYLQHHFGWRADFLFMTVYTCCCAVLFYLYLPETHTTPQKEALKYKTLKQNYLHLITNPLFMGYCVCASLPFGGFAAYLAMSPFLFQNVIGISSITYGWLILILVAGLVGGSLINAHFIKALGRHRMLVIGIFLILFSGCLMLILALRGFLNIFVIMLPMFSYTMGAGITMANAFASALHPFAKMVGFASALYGFLQILGGAIFSTVIAICHEKNQIPLSIIFVFIGISCYILQYMAFRHAVKERWHHPEPLEEKDKKS